jgi:two-component system chemotaxis sensor kinase CheA
LESQFLDDFFGEADEHLVGIRQELLQFEGSVDKGEPDARIVTELFQNFHSFKGISAIVGLAPAEALAHATEDFLRLMRDRKVQLTRKGLEVLTTATQKLEQVVAAFRSKKPMPGCESVLADLKELCEQSPLSGPIPTRKIPGDAALAIQIEEAKARGLLLWKYTFSPTHQLDAKGVNVNFVRERLSEIGEILKAAPQVTGQGMIAFEFLVAARETPNDLPAWEAQGITVQSAEQEEPASPAGVAAVEETEHNPFLAPSHIVRVDLKRLDDLMRITGEMVIYRSRLDAQMARLNGGGGRVDLRGVQEVSASLGRSLRELREAIMRVRLVPVAEIFARMPFLVRDLSRETRKKARLKLAGQDTLIDKYLIERLKDPLLHLVRNAFSHGVETPEERAAASKPAEATIELGAATVGDSVILRVKDDGKGINPSAILQRARKLGLELPQTVDQQTILQILCSPGFSTREDADRAAGRGVGMTVVHAAIRELGGNLTLESEEGRGTQFTIRLPLTLAVVEALLLTAAGQRCAIPQSCVQEILHTAEGQIQMANGVEVIPYREGVLPIVRLAGLFRLASASRPKLCLLVIASDRGSVGLLAEEVLGQREIVVSALRDPLIQVPGISGATELGDGKPVLILDAPALTRGSVRPPQAELPAEAMHPYAEKN